MMLDYQIGDALPVHEHGYVKLMKVMGDDGWIEYSARMSYDDAKVRTRADTRNLLRYLLRHRHTSPFEMGVMVFEVKMPLFIARQWVRHRTCSMNEVSARYTQLPNEMFVPESFSVQAKNNKQGRDEELPEDLQQELRDYMEFGNALSYMQYEKFLGEGVAKETAREALNLNIYTKFVWKMDVHNLMHFLDLRLDKHAQEEIRDYAEIIEKLFNLKFPITAEAFRDYVRDSYICSRMEIEALRGIVHDIIFMNEQKPEIDLSEYCMGMSKREIAEFKEKFL